MAGRFELSQKNEDLYHELRRQVESLRENRSVGEFLNRYETEIETSESYAKLPKLGRYRLYGVLDALVPEERGVRPETVRAFRVLDIPAGQERVYEDLLNRLRDIYFWAMNTKKSATEICDACDHSVLLTEDYKQLPQAAKVRLNGAWDAFRSQFIFKNLGFCLIHPETGQYRPCSEIFCLVLKDGDQTIRVLYRNEDGTYTKPYF